MPFPSTSFETALERARTYYWAGELTKAEDIYKNILQHDPHHIVALNNLGSLLQRQGRLNESIEMFRKLVVLKPDMAMAHDNLASVLCEDGKLEESFLSYRVQAALTYPAYKASLNNNHPHLIKHEAEQQAYLKSIKEGHIDSFYIDEGRRVSDHALTASASQNDAAQWQKKSPRLIIIDDLLTAEALQALQHFCWNSSIWRQSYAAGYLGAMPEHGMGSPLLAQISEELRTTHPCIFAQHPLLHYWGFKYDSQLKGTSLHADFAAINVNFWITPDEANLSPGHGGLIVWDTGAPKDWNFAKYNADSTSARTFLDRAKAKPIKIPYQCNRAVIFDSNLFHETDQFHFEEGYMKRRINITMLYGRREEMI